MYVNPKRVYVNSAAFNHVSPADIKVMKYFESVGDIDMVRRFYRMYVDVIANGLAPPSFESLLIYLRNYE